MEFSSPPCYNKNSNNANSKILSPSRGKKMKKESNFVKFGRKPTFQRVAPWICALSKINIFFLSLERKNKHQSS